MAYIKNNCLVMSGGGGAELNIHCGLEAPQETSKLWVVTDTPPTNVLLDNYEQGDFVGELLIDSIRKSGLSFSGGYRLSSFCENEYSYYYSYMISSLKGIVRKDKSTLESTIITTDCYSNNLFIDNGYLYYIDSSNQYVSHHLHKVDLTTLVDTGLGQSLSSYYYWPWAFNESYRAIFMLYVSSRTIQMLRITLSGQLNIYDDNVGTTTEFPIGNVKMFGYGDFIYIWNTDTGKLYRYNLTSNNMIVVSTTLSHLGTQFTIEQVENILYCAYDGNFWTINLLDGVEETIISNGGFTDCCLLSITDTQAIILACNGEYSKTYEIPLNSGNLKILNDAGLNANTVNIINTDNIQIKCSPLKVYQGNASNKAVEVTTKIYNGSTWETI